MVITRRTGDRVWLFCRPSEFLQACWELSRAWPAPRRGRGETKGSVALLFFVISKLRNGTLLDNPYGEFKKIPPHHGALWNH